MNKELPISTTTKFDNMMLYAYPLSVLEAYPNLRPWVMENYIIPYTYQPIFPVSDVALRMLYMDAYSFYERYSVRQTVLHQENYEQKFFDNVSVVDFIRQQISDGKYIILFSDDYYFTEFGVNNHRLHETLYYGFNDDCNAFKVLGMVKGKYGYSELSYSAVNHAFLMGHICEIHGDIVWARKHRAIVLSKLYNKYYQYDPQRVIEKLAGFCNGEVSAYESTLDISNGQELISGINYYKFIANKFESQSITQSFRYVHHMYEHFKSLYERLSYLSNVQKNQIRNLHDLRYGIETIKKIRLKLLHDIILEDKGVHPEKKSIAKLQQQLYDFIECQQENLNKVLNDIQ